MDRRSFLASSTLLAAAPLSLGVQAMADAPTNARKNFGDIAPALADYTDKVLFGDLWKRPNLSPRDRSLVTITALIALYRRNDHTTRLLRGMAGRHYGVADRPQGV
jgi:4-carboxymuconolactone decarboxylase